MTRTLLIRRSIQTLLLAFGLGWSLLAVAEDGDAHAHHAMPDRLASEFRILQVFDDPDGFPDGHLTYDAASERLFLISFGPPANTKGPSVLYELDRDDGRVLRRAQMPFVGEFGSPAFAGGHLYQIIDHQSTLYRISVEGESFGEIVARLPLPKLKELEYDATVPLRFPFVAFRGLSRLDDDRLLVHAQDLGELMVLDTEGKVIERVQTLRSLNGIAAASGRGGERLVLANSDPIKANFEYHVRRYMFRAEPGMVPPVRYGKRAIHWLLLDGQSGEILASLRRLEPRAEAKSVALIGRADVAGAPYGRFTFFALGEEGVYTVEWTPGKPS